MRANDVREPAPSPTSARRAEPSTPASGFEVNEEFSDAGCACIVVSDTIFVMLLVRERFADFVTGAVATRRPGRR